jgi:hypothetical protein
MPSIKARIAAVRQGLEQLGWVFGRNLQIFKPANAPYPIRLLRVSIERPCRHRAADQANKFAPSHCPSQVLESGMVAGQTGRLEVVRLWTGNVRFGSRADIAVRLRNVRFTPPIADMN